MFAKRNVSVSAGGGRDVYLDYSLKQATLEFQGLAVGRALALHKSPYESGCHCGSGAAVLIRSSTPENSRFKCVGDERCQKLEWAFFSPSTTILFLPRGAGKVIWYDGGISLLSFVHLKLITIIILQATKPKANVKMSR